jgi:hypothetical protein
MGVTVLILVLVLLLADVIAEILFTIIGMVLFCLLRIGKLIMSLTGHMSEWMNKLFNR